MMNNIDEFDIPDRDYQLERDGYDTTTVLYPAATKENMKFILCLVDDLLGRVNELERRAGMGHE